MAYNDPIVTSHYTVFSISFFVQFYQLPVTTCKLRYSESFVLGTSYRTVPLRDRTVPWSLPWPWPNLNLILFLLIYIYIYVHGFRSRPRSRSRSRYSRSITVRYEKFTFTRNVNVNFYNYKNETFTVKRNEKGKTMQRFLTLWNFLFSSVFGR